jgi:HK97 gp10 family phage protein
MSITGSVVTTTDTSGIDALILRFALIDPLIAKYAALIEAAAKRYVPVKTGALKASITTELEAMAATITAGEGLTYAAAVEYGTSRMASRAYMRPAFEQYAPAFVAELQALIGG